MFKRIRNRAAKIEEKQREISPSGKGVEGIERNNNKRGRGRR